MTYTTVVCPPHTLKADARAALDANPAGAARMPLTPPRAAPNAPAQLPRQTLVLAGDHAWCRLQAAELLCDAPTPVLWVGEPHDANPPVDQQVPAAASHQVLGSEVGTLVFDAHDGFDPDAFGAATGTLRGGGRLLLLTPPLDAWPQFADPERRRIATAPYPPEAVGGRFVCRLAAILRERASALIEQQGPRRDPLPPAPLARPDTPAPIIGPDQARAIDAVVRVATGQRRRPVVLTADRGRGKSAALGIAAARLLRDGHRCILVTAPRLAATGAVFAHCLRALPEDAVGHPGRVDWRGAELRFLAPDQLLADPPPPDLPQRIDLLLVDEAAGLTTGLLDRLLQAYNRIAFATTVHGYEGSGRGFALRFTRSLDRGTRGWRNLRLTTPVRWAAGDPLEALGFRALLLDAEAADDAVAATASPASCHAETLDRDRLVEDETALGELFGLLVQAHYRTRPYDLRHLLDGPNLSILVLRHQGHIIATAVVAAEGGFDAAACRDIWAGRRRPHGHLLPESLAAHLGLEQAPRLRCLRVMRVAVHPAARRRGLGRRLLDELLSHGRRCRADYLGSSFGADPGLLAFWLQAGYRPVRVSIKPGAASGLHSAILLRGLSGAGTRLTEAARTRFDAQLPLQLGDHLQDLDPALARQLLAGLSPLPVLDRQDWQDLLAFGCAGRVFEACLSALDKLTLQLLAQSRPDPLTDDQADLLLRRVLQHWPWQRLATAAGLSGRAQVIQGLRGAVRTVLMQHPYASIRRQAEELTADPRPERRGG